MRKPCCNESSNLIWYGDGTAVLASDNEAYRLRFCPFCGHDLSQPVLEPHSAPVAADGPITLVFDFDGVICVAGSVDYSQAVPYQHAIDIINGLYDEKDEQGNKAYFIRIQTARFMARCYQDQAKARERGWFQSFWWLNEHGVKFDELTFGKSSADLYADDRGCRVESAKGTTDWERNFFPALENIKAKRRKAHANV